MMLVAALGVSLVLGLGAWAHPTTPAEPPPVCETTLGKLKGTVFNSWSGQPFYGFRGIRYAKPPIKDLRFKPPVSPDPWEGVAEATKDGPSCVQFFGDYYGNPSEDCLFLNVYTKSLTGSRPVIVFFHPGGFFAQTGKSNFFGPQYLLDKDIVLVTVNYRLGTLGFFSTGDEHAVGNYGLKDQVAALKWVSDNIERFGGNPDKVTIAGDGTGATSVLLHMVSPMSEGLFHRVIAMSGGVTHKWAVTQHPEHYAKRVGTLLDCDTSSSAALVECMMHLPAQKIQDQFQSLRKRGHDPAIVYGAVVEPDLGDGEDRFLTADPVTLIREKKFSHVPLMIGLTKNEWENRAVGILKNETLRHEFDTDFETWAPIAFYYEKDTEKSKQISHKLREFYIGEGEIKSDSYGLGKLYSDAILNYGILQTAKLFTHYSNSPVYFYMTNYQGRYSVSYKDKEKKIPSGVIHMDDLMYLFHMPKEFPNLFQKTDPEAKMVKTFTSIWSNMARNGNPTPSTVSFQWTPMRKEEPQYLNLDKTISMKLGIPHKERMDLWETIYPTFPQHKKKPAGVFHEHTNPSSHEHAHPSSHEHAHPSSHEHGHPSKHEHEHSHPTKDEHSHHSSGGSGYHSHS